MLLRQVQFAFLSVCSLVDSIMDELQNRQQSHHAEDGGQLSSSTGINMSISGTPHSVLIIQAEGK